MLRMIDEDTDFRMNERTVDIRVWKGSSQYWSFDAQGEKEAAAPEQDAISGAEQLRSSYQARLHEQQQRQTIRSELEELRVQGMIRLNGKEKASDALLALLDEEEDE